MTVVSIRESDAAAPFRLRLRVRVAKVNFRKKNGNLFYKPDICAIFTLFRLVSLVFDFELKRFLRFASPIFVLAVVWIDG
jgi:hypothetical protein